MPLTSVRNKNTIVTSGTSRKKVGKNLSKEENDITNKKRMATSPAKGDIVKRSAFGDITNAIAVPNNDKITIKKQTIRKLPPKQKKKSDECVISENKTFNTLTKSAHKTFKGTRKSQSMSQINSEKTKPADDDTREFTGFYEHEPSPERKALKIVDIDKENITNPNETPNYGFVIFEYMRSREKMFPLTKYMTNSLQEITPDMRSILIDWMVEVQENFELNHETLYLAVKLTDHYLSQTKSSREILQLIGAAAMLIAAKFDERHPPYIDDFLYICDDAYNRKEILSMERMMLQKIGFDINIPISYRYLRRYAKCSKTNMETLTLARFSLELSLQHYEFVGDSDSLLAAAALWLAFKMKNSTSNWSDTLVYFTSHREHEVAVMASRLNKMIQYSKGRKLQTVWQKYSHTIFYEVANIPTLTDNQINNELDRITKYGKQ